MFPEKPLHHDAAAVMTCEQLSGRCGLSMVELGELVGYSALIPVANEAMQTDINGEERWLFSAQWIEPLRAASKMRHDFDLDIFTVAVVLGSLRRINVLEQRIRALQQGMNEGARTSTHQALELVSENYAHQSLTRPNS